MNRHGRNALGLTVGYFVALELMLVAAVLYWPNFRENTGALKVLSAPIPQLRELIEALEQTGAVGYVIGQHFFKGCNVLGCAAASLFAAGAIAGEAQRGTLEVFLARPLSRRRLLLERWAAGALQVTAPIFLTTLTLPLLLPLVGESVDLGRMLLCGVHQSLFLLCIHAAAFLASTLGRNPLRIAFLVLLVCIFEFAIYMVKEVTHWSLFRLVDIQSFLDVYESGSLPLGWTAAFLTVIATCLGASLWAFERRTP